VDFQINSLYLCVLDMDRAIRFYEDFLEQSVTLRDKIYSVFDVHGFRLGLFAYREMREEHVFGSNCLPSIAVASLDDLKRKTEGLEIEFPLAKIGTNWVTEFEDSEGNHIELTAPASQS
jgi:predicted enzyme related to lactoylglutathione lyase